MWFCASCFGFGAVLVCVLLTSQFAFEPQVPRHGSTQFPLRHAKWCEHSVWSKHSALRQ